MRDWKSLSHVKWECKYHIVWVPKYRRRVLYGRLRSRVGEIMRVNVSISKQIERGREILAQAGGVRAYDEHVRRTKEPPSWQEV